MILVVSSLLLPSYAILGALATTIGGEIPPHHIALSGPAGYEDVILVPGVDISAGVGESNARAIAEFVFTEHAGVGCGFVGEAAETATAWRFETRIGYGGTPGADLVVRKDTGAVSWPDLSLLETALVELSSTLRVVGPRPLHFVAFELPTEIAARLEDITSDLDFTFAATVDSSGRIISLGPLAVTTGDKALGRQVAHAISDSLQQWRFYPEIIKGGEAEVHFITVLISPDDSPESEP